jgi:DNA-directed RNA polymerase I, II, and III subunit RPABC2
MPSKKKEIITKDVPPIKTEEDNENDDKESVSTDSDIVSGTFSDLNNEEQDQEDEESVDSEVESIELEPEIAEEEAEAEAELEEAEAEVEEEKVVSKKKAVKKTVVINNDCLYNNIDFEEDYAEKEEQVDSSNRITMNRLTKYEKVRIIGIRTKQIMTGANILIKGIDGKTPSEIAELELKYNMVPFKIKRKLPNGKFEIWKLSELEK